MAGRKPKKVGMTMMYDNGSIPVMVFEKYFLVSGLVYSNKSASLLAIVDKCYRCILRHCSDRVESEACHEANVTIQRTTVGMDSLTLDQRLKE